MLESEENCAYSCGPENLCSGHLAGGLIDHRPMAWAHERRSQERLPANGGGGLVSVPREPGQRADKPASARYDRVTREQNPRSGGEQGDMAGRMSRRIDDLEAT